MTGEQMRSGRTLDDRFELLRRLGEGGWSNVWLARDHETHEDVAVKMLHPSLRVIANAVDRLRREAAVLRSLEHPRIARAHFIDFEPETPYFALEYVPGPQLQEEVGRRAFEKTPFDAGSVLELIEQIAEAVQFAHDRGVVHRDLKPSNIILTDQGPKLLDFGVSKLMTLSGTHDETTIGRIMGSFQYMAPEQIRGERVDRGADQFSLAVLAFELATLKRTWCVAEDGSLISAYDGPVPKIAANSKVEIAARVVENERASIASVRPQLAGWDSVIDRAMAALPEKRYASMTAFTEALREATPLDATRMLADRGVAPRTGTLLRDDEPPELSITPIVQREPPGFGSGLEGSESGVPEPSITPIVHLEAQTRVASDSPAVSQPQALATAVDEPPAAITRTQQTRRTRSLAVIVVAVGAAALGLTVVGLLQRADAPDSPRPAASETVEVPIIIPERPFASKSDTEPETPAVSTPPTVERATVRPAKRTPSPKRRISRAAAPRGSDGKARKLFGVLSKLEPGDLAGFRALGSAVQRAAADVPDAKLQRRIVRIAKTSALAADAEGMKGAIRLLERGIPPARP